MLFDPTRLRSRADNARTIAEMTLDQKVRNELLLLAESWELLAMRSEELNRAECCRPSVTG